MRRLEIPGRLTLREGKGGLPKLELTSDQARAEVYPHGAHLTAFQKAHEPPVLFTSAWSRFARGTPIRGGIPIILPWFGAREGAPMHGFARTADWHLTETSALPRGGVSLRFSLPEVPPSRTWPPFTAFYAITLTDRLDLELLLTNTAPNIPLTLENCLHTYLAISDLSQVSLHGLQDVAYLDKTKQFARKSETAAELRIHGETDRIYLDAPPTLELRDLGWHRLLRLDTSGARSAVVWNPGRERSRLIEDLGDDEHQRMLCVESGNVADNHLLLAPGQSSRLSLRVGTETLVT